jgi:hypothetical protein
VAPRSGLYVFMMSALSYGSYAYSCKFHFSNGMSQPDVYVDSQSGYYDSASYMSFAWLTSGQSVYVSASKMRKTSVFAGWQLVDDMSGEEMYFHQYISLSIL